LRLPANFIKQIKLIWVVQSSNQKHFALRGPQITFIFRAIPHLQEGRIAIVTYVGAGCSGRGSVGRDRYRRAAFAVSDQTGRGRTTLIADDEAVWS
jgi:hypothetical protein